ncbi:SGNH/GDSL hydrolase family protein [Paraburkholderia sp. CNPSo 3076]|uniref:SGNH/GDSL hydrolase family protein n=1 Tax=Paraburkholderia sp. CNPSo 3076 TaxID=2940936 RepID=UPI00225733AD|nr:SGNH/GDSL hydrolase family protein [Paraburkholderia sp. CNPSo 3076]MCX5545059.1 SGNH/GDSL hydrolase family protein [Paraburkholderia sp. CNPSo 3076]
MKHQGPRHRTLLRATQIAAASAAFALLAACGGSSGGNNNASTPPPSGVNMQVVAFGTSLSDAGTYSEQILPGFGGGRFTTNPGEVWAQHVSEYFGNTLSPAFEGGFGLPLTATGGLDYAQGGALVTGGGVANTSAVIAAASEQPVTWQLQQYLAQHGSFSANQLVLVEGGANEILNLLDVPTNGSPTGLALFGAALAATPFSTLVNDPATQQSTVASLMQSGFTQAQATALVPAAIALGIVTNPNYASSFASIAPVLTAAGTLGALVHADIVPGNPKIAVVTVPDIGKTPAALKADAAIGATPGSASSADQALSLISAMYNLTLIKATAADVQAKKVVLVDTFSWLDQSIANAASLGFTVTNTDTACNLTAMTNSATNYALANPQATLGLNPATTPQATINAYAAAYGQNFGSSLFCSPQTLTTANAPTTYMFADLVHPTTALHSQFAKYVETQLAAAGIGKAP